MKRVMAFGTFDLLHPGHLFYLETAKQYGDYLIVIVARDSTAKLVKGKSPRQSEHIRLAQIQKISCVDIALLGSVHDPHAVIYEFLPRVICLGYDQKHFTENLKMKFPHIQIVRAPAMHPQIFKSSKLAKLYDRYKTASRAS